MVQGSKRSEDNARNFKDTNSGRILYDGMGGVCKLFSRISIAAFVYPRICHYTPRVRQGGGNPHRKHDRRDANLEDRLSVLSTKTREGNVCTPAARADQQG